jgi:predicted ester cyclase
VTAEENRALIQRFYDEGWNANDLAVYDELVTPDFIDHQALPGLGPGREGFKQLNAMFRSAFPDVWVNVDGIVTEGDFVACRWTSTGTHKGDLFGIAPTGRAVKVTATVVYRVDGGRLAEGWINRDDLGMMRQLGVIPTPG